MTAKRLLVIAISLSMAILSGCIGSGQEVSHQSHIKASGQKAKTLPKYSREVSITYKTPYPKLQQELEYAQILSFEDKGKSKTLSLVKEKKQLVYIVREFDKLKASAPIELAYDVGKGTGYSVTVWRDGNPVSYLLLKLGSEFYYFENPCEIGGRRVPASLVKMLGFNS